MPERDASDPFDAIFEEKEDYPVMGAEDWAAGEVAGDTAGGGY